MNFFMIFYLPRKIYSMDTLNFKSCFIVGVKLNDELAILEDSAHCKYFVKAENKEAMQSFKSWFNNVYIKGIH